MQNSWKKEPSDGWFDPHTLTILAALSATGAVILSMVASGGTGLYRGDELTFGGYVTISLFGLFALMAQLLRLEAVWIGYAGALRKPPRERSALEKQRVEHGFIEFFVYLAAGLMGLSYVAYAASDDGRLGQLPVRLSGAGWNVSHLTLYLLMFGAAFVPLIIGFARQAKLEARQRSDGQDARLLRDDVVSELSFWASFLLVAGLVALAWAAAGGKFQMKEDFGVFITFVVLLVFFVIILAPHVMRFLNEFREKRTIDRTTIKMAGLPALQPGVWTSRLDSILVRLVAPL
ncbi:MAG: hypothetical protein VX593_06750 [Pseudomonadota bacterium]|nr:hypothetical protein [Pseudomonadota bacterium]